MEEGLNLENSRAEANFFLFLFPFSLFLCTFAGEFLKFDARMVCRDGGMVDTRDLKSLGYCSCAGSSPARGTRQQKTVRRLPYEVSGLFLIFLILYNYMRPRMRSTSLRLATTNSSISKPKPTYSALIMKFSEGLRRVIIS